ncbi:MAG: SDR family oxidoreductase [Pseudomonadota bacterium]
MSLDGRVAIVTGGAHGIGEAIVRRYAADGASVVIADLDTDAGEALAKELSDENTDVMFVHCNVAERLSIHNLVAATIERFGAIHVLVNNAGIVSKAGFLDIDEETFDRVLAINLKGGFLAGQAVAKQMIRQIEDGGAPGVIINMSSINAVFAIADQVPYSISKGGVGQLTKVMALALAPYGIRVNAIGPGSVMTRMLEAVNADAAARRTVLSRTPMGRIGLPAEIAGVAAFLASDDASYVTGQTLYADGGRLGLNYVVPVAD